MELVTLANARELLWEYGASGPEQLKVPLASATAAEKAYWRGKINQTVERFLTMGKWRGCWVRATLPIYDGTITLPRHLQSCSGVNLSCGPRPIYSRFWEFSYAVGSLCCSNGVIPLTDSAQTFLDPAADFKLRIKSATAADNGLLVSFLGGTDSSDAELFTTAALTITAGTPATTGQVYSVLPRIAKVTTTGPVELYGVDNTTAVETLIAIYAPGELVPAYKRYQIYNVGEDDTTASALCKLAYVPAVADTDLIIPGVYGALKHGLKALTYEDTSDDRQDAEWQRAINVLNDDRHELDGEAQPVFRFDQDFGAGSIQNVM